MKYIGIFVIFLSFTGCIAPVIHYQDKNSISVDHRESDIGLAMNIAKEHCNKNGFDGIIPSISIPNGPRRTTTFICK